MMLYIDTFPQWTHDAKLCLLLPVIGAIIGTFCIPFRNRLRPDPMPIDGCIGIGFSAGLAAMILALMGTCNMDMERSKQLNAWKLVANVEASEVVVYKTVRSESWKMGNYILGFEIETPTYILVTDPRIAEPRIAMFGGPATVDNSIVYAWKRTFDDIQDHSTVHYLGRTFDWGHGGAIEMRGKRVVLLENLTVEAGEQ